MHILAREPASQKKRILKKTQQALRPSRILKPTHQEQQRAAPGAESDIYNGFVQACEKTCYQRDVIKNCQCSDAYYPPSNASAFNHVVVPVCSTSNITQGNSTQTPLHRFHCASEVSSASEVTTLWRYTNLFIIIIIIII